MINKAHMSSVALWLLAGTAFGQAKLERVERLDVAPVWSGCPVGFAMLTHSNRQFLAYYSDERTMTLAQRELNTNVWTFASLPSKLGWDSHNYVTLALDETERGAGGFGSTGR